MSGGTITRHITLFVGADHKDLPKIMQAARDARDLFRNDADMTTRLIKARPEREEDYKQAWATAAEKQLLNVYSIIKETFDAEGRPLTFEPDDGPMVTACEIDNWTTPAPKQEEHPGSPMIPDEMPPKAKVLNPDPVEPEPIKEDPAPIPGEDPNDLL
jgi:hypothetical protein